MIEEVTDPFGGRVTIRLKEFDMKGGYKPSTYGMIKGATFFLLGIGGDDASALSAGFRFEQVVLKARQLGLGTCWIAATFKGSEFDHGESWPDGERLTVICPVGVPAKRSMMEKITRLSLGSKTVSRLTNCFSMAISRLHYLRKAVSDCRCRCCGLRRHLPTPSRGGFSSLAT